MPEQLKTWRGWLHGLVAAAISGGATAVSLSVVDPSHFTLDLLWKVGGLNAILSAVLYLKKSPIPGGE